MTFPGFLVLVEGAHGSILSVYENCTYNEKQDRGGEWREREETNDKGVEMRNGGEKEAMAENNARSDS